MRHLEAPDPKSKRVIDGSERPLDLSVTGSSNAVRGNSQPSQPGSSAVVERHISLMVQVGTDVVDDPARFYDGYPPEHIGNGSIRFSPLLLTVVAHAISLFSLTSETESDFYYLFDSSIASSDFSESSQSGVGGSSDGDSTCGSHIGQTKYVGTTA